MRTSIWIDPGVMNGWCKFEIENGMARAVAMGQVHIDDLTKFLEKLDPTPSSVGYESYKIFRKKAGAHIGSDVPALQAIGMIKSYASRHGKVLRDQPSSILKTAEMWTGIYMPSDHSQSHQIAALLHGSYFYITEGMMRTRLEENHGQI